MNRVVAASFGLWLCCSSTGASAASFVVSSPAKSSVASGTLAVPMPASLLQHVEKIVSRPLLRDHGRRRHDNGDFLRRQHDKFLSLRGGASTSSTTTKLQFSPVSFDSGHFWQYNGIMLAANAVGFAISLLSGGSHKHLDLIGTGAFAVAALSTSTSFATSGLTGIQLSAACVALWASKLASFLFFRALQVKHDQRLTETLATTSGTFLFWFVSLFWGVVCSLPHSLGATSSYNTQQLVQLQNPCTVIGLVLFGLGWMTETAADLQKWNFKQSTSSPQFCNVGLWSISQHPNFVGNLLLWTGIFLLNAPALIEPASATTTAVEASLVTTIWQTCWRYRRLVVSAISPLFLLGWFSAQASGQVSNTQALSLQKYGKDPNYQTYLDTVPLLLPKNPWQLISNLFVTGKQ